MSRLWLLFLFVLWVGVPQAAASIPMGERLVYKISWLGIPVGMGEVRVREKTTLAGRAVIRITGMIKTNRILSKIFPMHDEAHSWVDAETFESVQFEKDINELWIKAHERMVFDAGKGKGYFESFKTGEKAEFDIPGPVHDVLSVFYWMRRQPLVPGESVETSLMADRKEWELEARVLDIETVKFQGRKVETFQIEPVTRVEGLERRGKALFNVTTDAARVPVRIVYHAPFGSVVGTLVHAQWKVNE